MRFLRAIFCRPSKGVLHDPAREPVLLTVEGWASFLRAGGSITLGEWLSLDDETREAMERAGVAVGADLACGIAQALSGEDGLAEVASRTDGGRSKEERAARAALDAAMALMRRQEHQG